MLSITVDTLVDVVDANDGRTSFREAIADAPAHGSAVDFHASLDGGTIELNSQLNISQTIQVIGPGADKLTIDARQTGRVFHVFSGVGMATISGLKITGGLQGPGGGGVLNEGSLKLLNVVVSGNQSTVHGGGVFSNGPYLEINSSAIENNRASWGGGVAGDLAGNEWIYILNSTIADNVADDPDSSNGQGAGVRVSVSSTSTIPNLEIHNSTISGNRSESQGGGVHLTGITRANIRNVTIVNNRADVHSGGIFNEAAPVLMRNSVLAGNTAGDAARADGSGSLSGQFNVTSRYNFVGADHSSFQILAANSNILGPAPNPLDPKVSPLTNVGGLTRVHVPLPGSPIVDHGADGDASGLTGDQRGSSRFIEDSTTPNAPGNVSDIGPVELEARLAVGDFNGDGREDELRYSPALKSLLVAEKGATGAGWEVGAWGSLALATNPSPTSTNGIIVGDFNGDGRDDVMTLNSDYSWLIGISDGTLFHINKFKNGSGPFYAGWQYVYVGDFDADGDEEIIGKVNGGTNWTLVEYSPITGGTKATTVNLSGFTPGTHVFVQDVNRDGKDDFITRLNGSSPWKVNLSQGTSTGTLLFANAVEMNAWIGYGYTTATGELDADKAMAKVIEEFAWVYNNVELELYPGLMKGPTATEQTKAGNDWDQAALLEERLQDSGVFPAEHVKIASGQVVVQVGQLKEWLGLKPSVAASTLESIIKTAFDASATLINASTAIKFTHAWVQAYAPTAIGFAWVDLDPSWKMKDRTNGIPLPNDLDSVRTQLGVFDEIGYLALDPTIDRRLPIEYFEDQVMDWLSNSSLYRGNSVAEVSYDGPIMTRSFQQLPAGMWDGVVVADPTAVVQHEDAASIASNEAFAHRMTIRLKNEATQHWTQTLAVPSHSLDSIQISFASTAGDAQSNPNAFASAGSATFYSRLVVGGSILKSSPQGLAFAASDNATIEVEHHGPTGLVSGLALSRQVSFSRKPGKIIAVGIDANQHSRDSLAALQSKVLAAVAVGDSETQLRKAIDDLVAYAGAKYWDDFNRYNRSVEGITGSIGIQEWVGSGLVTADPTLLLDPVPEGASDYAIEYLPFGIAPANFGVDLPNSNHSVRRIDNGATNSEAWQLLGYNSSALEHNIVEEIISAGAVSTMKGLQQAFQRDMGLNGSGTQLTVDVVQEYSRKKVNGVWEVRHVGNWYGNGMAPVMAGSPVNVNITSNVSNYLLATTNGQLRYHNNHTTLGNTIVSLLTTGEEEVRVLVPLGRTELNDWVGGVYLVEKANSMQFAIQADGGVPSSGGYSGGVTTAPPPELPTGNFTYAGYAGDPVHTSNGNMFRDETDIVFPNIGVPLTFSRHYDSQSKDDVGMGVGWTYSFSDMLYLDEKATSSTNDDEVVWYSAGGARYRFKKLSDGTFVTPAELKGKLVRQASNEYVTGGFKYVYLDPNGMDYHFQEQNDAHPNNGFDGPHTAIGRLRMQRDQNGDGVSIDYINPVNGHGFTQIRDLHNSNRRLVFDYRNVEGINRISTIQKYDGGTTAIAAWNFTYVDVSGVTDTIKRLASVSSPAVTVVDGAYQESTASTTVTYEYYNTALGDPPYAKGMIKKITESDGSWHTYEYYRNGRVFRVMQSETSPPPVTPPPPPAPTVADLSGFVGLNNTSAPNSYTAGSTSAGGTFVDVRSTAQGSAYLADTSLAVPGGVLTATTPGGFSATGTLTFNVNSSYNPFFFFGFFDKDNPGNRAFGFMLSDDSVSTAMDFHPAAGTASPSAGDSVAQGTYSFVITVGTDSPSPKVFLELINSSGQTIVARTANIVPGLTPEADAFGFLQPSLATGFSGTFNFSVSNLRYTGETLIVPEEPPEPPAAPTPDVDVQTFNYNLFKNSTEFTDERGNIETYFHQKNGLQEKQIHADRSQTKATWGAAGTSEEFLMKSTTDERGAKETFTYYSSSDFKNGRLQTSTEKAYPNAAGLVPDALVTKYDYVQPDSSKPHLVALSTTIVDPDASPYVGRKITTSNQYYNSGDSYGKLWQATDAEENILEYSYYTAADGGPAYRLGLLKSIKRPTILDLAGNPVAYETVLNYDAAGNVTSSRTQTAVVAPAAPIVVSESTFVYDSSGNVTQTIVGANVVAERVVTESLYDTLGRLRETGFADANATIDPYDAFASRYKYDKWGRIRESIDPLGRVTRFEYDRQGNVVKQINPDGTELLHEYDAFGNRVATTDALKRTMRFVYDNRNRLIQTILPGGAVERLRYDGAGNVVAKIDALGNATTFKYDASGRLLETKLPDPDGPNDEDGDGTNLTSPTTTNKYDKLGNLIESIDPEANVTQFKYDKLGRAVQTQTLKSVNGDRNASTPWVVTGTLQSLTTTDYDAVGNVIETAAYDVSLYDPGSTLTLLANPRAEQDLAPRKVQVVSIRYDAFGRPVKTNNADGTSTRTEYDSAGRVRFQYDEANSVTEFIYDAFGRLEKTRLSDPTTGTITTASPTTTYQYDAVGNRIGYCPISVLLGNYFPSSFLTICHAAQPKSDATIAPTARTRRSDCQPQI